MNASTFVATTGGYKAVSTKLKIVVFTPASKAYIAPASGGSSACALRLRRVASGILPATLDRCTCAGVSREVFSVFTTRRNTCKDRLTPKHLS